MCIDTHNHIAGRIWFRNRFVEDIFGHIYGDVIVCSMARGHI